MTPTCFTPLLEQLRSALASRSPQAAHLAFRLLETHSPQLALHSLRVASLTQEISLLCGYSENPVDLRLGALLHDLGKILLPTELLAAARPLAADEHALVRRHPIEGVALLADAFHVPPFATIDSIAHHHERWDGAGYPCGLVGARIPLSARIVAVADVLEVLLRPRPYQDLAPKDPLAELRAAAGVQLDPDLTEHAFRYLPAAE